MEELRDKFFVERCGLAVSVDAAFANKAGAVLIPLHGYVVY